ncbi:hypothetical protein CBS101457_000540 [Exobasidium rhododendri]|nr:hypothetical protein CBS101457_000540 [Exobasidium rhododendri]
MILRQLRLARDLHTNTALLQHVSAALPNPDYTRKATLRHISCLTRASPDAQKRAYRPKIKSRMYSDSPADGDLIRNSPLPIFSNIAEFRRWRMEMMSAGRTVGFVPTMGALHVGHLSLVERSLAENDETVVSIFVNPAQFAPTEDLSSYPRTLSSDIKALSSISSTSKTVSAIFAPTVKEMYPSPDGRPFTQHVKEQQGAFVEVQGLAHQMEGASRPTFFRGVATIVTKLFHVVQPDLAYFGQKDIQQAIILRRLVSDLLFSHPPSAKAVRILATIRDERDGLALSSRNVYLTSRARNHAPILHRSLSAGEAAWNDKTFLPDERDMVEVTLKAAHKVAQAAIMEAEKDGVKVELLYISLNDPISLQDLSKDSSNFSKDRGAILSAAALVKEGDDGRVTRLIDNVLLGFTL